MWLSIFLALSAAVADMSGADFAAKHMPDGREIIDGPLCHGRDANSSYGFSCEAKNPSSYGVITEARIKADPKHFVLCDAPSGQLVDAINLKPVGQACLIK